MIDVPTTTIDEFCARQGILPDLIKIDVEGAELAVLKGARETIRAAGKHLALFVEMHPRRWRATRYTKEDLLEELGRQRLEPVPLAPHLNMWEIEGVCLHLRPRS